MKSADQTVLILRRKVTWITLHTSTQPEKSHQSSKLVFSFSSQVEKKKNYMKRTGLVKNCTMLLLQYHVWFRGCLMNSQWNLNNTTFFSRPTQLRYFKPRINFCCDVMIDTKTDKSGLGFPRKQNCKEIWTSKNMGALARGKRFRLLVVQLDFKRLKSCHLRFS